MKNITKSLIAGAVALAFMAQPAFADNGHRGDHRGHYDHYVHGHERVVYRPAPAYYYPVQRVAYYPPYYAPPVYAAPVASFGFIFR